jgi:hypothetical protein
MLKIYRVNSSSTNLIGNKLRLRGWHMSMSNLSNKVFTNLIGNKLRLRGWHIHAVDFIKSTILDQFEKSNSDLVVKLARDYVTFIKYSAGEFFEWHRDHERYVINQRDRWIEAHLMYCLKAPQVGGNLDILETMRIFNRLRISIISVWSLTS